MKFFPLDLIDQDDILFPWADIIVCSFVFIFVFIFIFIFITKDRVVDNELREQMVKMDVYFELLYISSSFTSQIIEIGK